MVYAIQQSPKNHPNQIDILALIDPTLLRTARQIYYTYCEVNPNLVQRTTGVAINQLTYRGMLMFSSKPILLPQECFVTLSQIELGILI